jgi:hypothetical protein
METVGVTAGGEGQTETARAHCSREPLPIGRSVTKIVAFFALVSGLLFSTDELVNTGLRRIETSSFGVTNRIVGGQISAGILITGSSRAQTHYDPRVVERATGLSTYNIGINGSQTDMQVAMLKTYLRHNRAPRLLIHNLDLFAFQTTKEIYDPAQYLPYLHEEEIYRAISRVHADAWKWKWLPLYGYATQDLRLTWLRGLKGLVGMNPPETHFLGFTPRVTDWTGDFEKYRESHPNGVAFEIEETGVKDLEDVALLARSANVPVLFVYSPEYYEMQRMERNRQDIFARFHAIASTSGAQVWDFSDSEICRNRTYFYNSQHLNALGAERFSVALAERIRESRLISAEPRTSGTH